MKILQFLAITLAILSIVACKPQETATQTAPSSSTATAVAASAPQENKVTPKPEHDISKIDFSQYPGVIKPGAFGYYFGLTLEQIEKAGIKLEFVIEEGPIIMTRTRRAPSAWSDAEYYLLTFYQGKLLKIAANGETTSGDITGSEGKATYQTLQKMLKDKYGSPLLSTHLVGQKLWDNRDEFYQCLAYDGCGAWVDLWEVPGIQTIAIQLKGLKRGEGFIQITYESQPELNNVLDEKNKSELEATKKGL